MLNILIILLYIFLAILVMFLVIEITNIIFIRRLGKFPRAKVRPLVSVCIPARDEEHNIAACLDRFLAQDYKNYEILVIDDNSGDSTGKIISIYAKKHKRIRAYKGKPLPQGWTGKCFACHQLSQYAKGDMLFFTDADTRPMPTLISSTVDAMASMKADFITGIPHEDAVTFGEKIVMPLLPMGIMLFLPILLAEKLPTSMLAISCGQFLFFRRSCYDAIGGHTAVHDVAVEDVDLGKRVKAAGLEWRFVDCTSEHSCRMYTSFLDAVAGLSRSIFGGMGYSIATLAFMVLSFTGMFCLPVITLPLSVWVFQSSSLYYLSLIMIGLSLLSWGGPIIRFGMPWYLTLLYPVSAAVAVFTFIRSTVLSVTGKLEWKGRPVIKHSFHL